MNPMQATITACRRSFGEPPRKLSIFALWRLRMPVPAWVKESGDRRFTEIFSHQSTLLRKGRVVWAATVQANVQLFEPGNADCPAAVLYSFDPRMDAQPGLLHEAARTLYSFKGQETADSQLQVFANKLADEMVIDLKLAVPLSLTSGIPCYYTCVMVHRGHLPDGKLSTGYYPLLAGADGTDATMILPSKYWPTSFVKLWYRRPESLPSKELTELANDNPVVAASLNYVSGLLGMKPEDFTGAPVAKIVFHPELGIIRNETAEPIGFELSLPGLRSFREEYRFPVAAGKHDLNSWVQAYYLAPKPNEVSEIIVQMRAGGLLRHKDVEFQVLGLLVELFAGQPNLVPACIPNVQRYDDADLAVILTALWLAGTPSSQALLREIGSQRIERVAGQHLLGPSAPRTNPLKMMHPGIMDYHWSRFFVTGDEDCIRKVVDHLPGMGEFAVLSEGPPWDTQSETYKRAYIGLSAYWSLGANALRHGGSRYSCPGIPEIIALSGRGGFPLPPGPGRL